MIFFEKNKKNGFTLIELLVVIAIIGLLSSIVLATLNSTRAKSRDTKRKAVLKQLSVAAELYFDVNRVYPGTAGWFTNPNHGGLDSALTPTHISKISDDPLNSGGYVYMYWRKDYRGYACLTSGTAMQYGFYAKLENPSATDLTTISDSFDICVRDTWGMNYKMGN